MGRVLTADLGTVNVAAAPLWTTLHARSPPSGKGPSSMRGVASSTKSVRFVRPGLMDPKALCGPLPSGSGGDRGGRRRRRWPNRVICRRQTIDSPGEGGVPGPASSSEPTRNWSSPESGELGHRSEHAPMPVRRNVCFHRLLPAGPTTCATGISEISSTRWTTSVPRSLASDLGSPRVRPRPRRQDESDRRAWWPAGDSHSTVLQALPGIPVTL